MNYFISHTGTVRNEDSSYDEREFYDRSGMTTVKTKCDCNFGKTISFYYDGTDTDDATDEARAEIIANEIKAKYDNKFLHCDSCEEYILEEIKKEYI